jgi:hypothetical protein
VTGAIQGAGGVGAAAGGLGTRALRWSCLDAAGAVLSRPGRLYYARLVHTAAASAVIRDGTVVTAPMLVRMATGAAGSDEWPKIPVSVGFVHGLYVEVTPAGACLMLGWETD